jgi:hypothetical protein
MLLASATFVSAQQVDTRPPFWWLGLFSSPGGLVIVGAIVTVIILAVLVFRQRFGRGSSHRD